MIGGASDRVPSLAAQQTLGKKTIGVGIFELRSAVLDISRSESEFGVRRIAVSTRSVVEFGNVAEQKLFRMVSLYDYFENFILLYHSNTYRRRFAKRFQLHFSAKYTVNMFIVKTLK